ncbi:hypothetical protein E4U43_004721 [Claviceps pusilla]|uniref:Uncharacterized protein n=1 Tax=Claviceps pusilla TaxID=123648 RepID=A0A9P7SZ72_9HYPO|nr:hypothetical protein E4U43_004721 [Claviceps pusilla]
MPRGRSLLLEVPASFENADTNEPRRTRSVSSHKATIANEIVSPGNLSSRPNRPRGRPSRASLLASHASSTASSPAPQPNLQKCNKRTSAIGDLSVSSGSTPLDTFSDEEDLSTPGTSKVPTPVIAEASGPSKTRQSTASFEIRLPGRANVDEFETDRALRNSVYSLNPTRAKRVIEILDSGDDDDDDDMPDFERDAKIARKLQEKEFSKEDENALPKPNNGLQRRSRRTFAEEEDFSTPLLPCNTSKRSRVSTRSSKQLAPPAKKSRTIPDSDSDDSLHALGIYLDSEVEFEIAAQNGEFSDISDFVEDSSADTLAEDDDGYTEDEPLSKRRKGKQPAQPKRTRKTVSKRGRGVAAARNLQRAIAIEDSGDELAADEDEAANVPSRLASMTPMSFDINTSESSDSDDPAARLRRVTAQRRAFRVGNQTRLGKERDRLETHHPEIVTMWDDLEKMAVIKAGMAAQPQTISRQLKPFQLEGLAWMKEMEKTDWRGGLLGDEMGLGKTIQAVSLIMSDYPAKQPTLVLVPPVALMQWQSEIKSYTDGTLKTFIYHGTNQKAKTMTVKELKSYDVIMMSYNSLESMYRKQEKGFKRKTGIHKEKSVIHSIKFHRIILDEAHCIKTRSTMTAKACFALQTNYRWCLSGTPLQNRIGEFFSLIRFLNVRPFALYLCKQCPCSTLEWSMNEENRCSGCKHAGMQHVSVFNQELLNPIQKFGNLGPGREAFRKLRLMTDRIMLRRLKRDHTDSMELPVKEVYVDRQFFGEEENDFASSIMTNGKRKFDTYVAQGVLLNNYANIFGLIMQMRQVADHPDLLLKKHADGGQNVLVCCICDEPAEDTIRSRCKHDFCRACVSGYVHSTDTPDCPSCHIALSIDLEQPEIEQDEVLVKKSSIINRIKMENWVSSSKIELLVHDLHKLRSDNASHKSIIFSQFTTMLQLIEWRLRRAGITTVMLDGSMTPAQRQASIEHFMTNVDVECFLVSLKAGGVALNLTEASRVFIVDPWWNPAAEWQSADRCHRIGQTRPCTITRLCIEDSVESRMVLIQEKKTNMIHSTINADDKAMESLTPEDMQFLFRGT